MKIHHKKFIFLAVFLIFVLALVLLFILSPNRELEINEIKAYFRATVSLNFHPDFENAEKIVIGGPAIHMSYYDTLENGHAIYLTKTHIEQITNYLNGLKLAKAQEDELPNQSPDYFIYYYNEKGIIKRFTVHGEVFIKDLEEKKLYRIKNTKMGIMEGLENLEFV
ncbi:hypothetical protein [Ructibacterium gallinarum]|uniref:Uncharacterized protein n=1 Tax=Ructibacterium gallinarum TaxID=2779355 RepID=A0A9D5R9Z5_9FIRM|nr:hypothetical protein [Ructibacterium gallinarum]MBE5040989.1 hypothetical protein [Ructibacterium gallinarum]